MASTTSPAAGALTGRQVRLRPCRIEDTEPFFVAARESADHVTAFGAWLHPGWSLQDAARMVESRVRGWQEGTEFCFAVQDPETGAYLGDCGLSQVERTNQRANLGYWVRAGYTGRGIASEAARLVAHWGLSVAGLQRIEVLVSAENEPSLRVARRIGAVREGLLRRRLLLHGRFHDAVLFSLTHGDLPAAERCAPAPAAENVP